VGSSDFGPEVRQATRLRAAGRCEACGKPEPNPDLHHRKLRSRGGTSSGCNAVALCRGCHTWAHMNPEATVLGFTVASWDDPALISIPSRMFGLPVYLLSNGDTMFDPPVA